MIRKEKFMINMGCLLMNKNNMKTWVSMVIKEVLVIFLVLKISQICGDNKDKDKDSKIFSEILKTFSVLVRRDNSKDR